MKNRKAQRCCWCGLMLEPGEGNLIHVDEESENLGFGPMGWTGWIVSCPDKAACNARIEAAKKVRAEKRAEEKRIDDLECALFSDGEYIRKENQFRVDGIEYERPGKGWTIYGSGTRYVVQENHIWKLENNGTDGGDWSMNNIRTGGAGAIGTRFVKTPERMAYLNEHAGNITEKEEKEEAEREQREIERKARIKEGLTKMLKRATWEELEAGMKKAKAKNFCPRELVVNGRQTVSLTLEEAKRIMSE